MPIQSCTYLEGGLSFAHSAVKACAIRHHGRGAPELQSIDAGGFDLRAMLEKRNSIRQENQGDGHPACRDCPHLLWAEWKSPEYPIHWLGITHYIACNLSCNYCWLSWAKWSPRNSAHHKPVARYELTPIIEQMDAANMFSPQTIVDWGGGGEPTLMPEFNWGFRLFNSKSFIQWLHTNAVRMPDSIMDMTESLPKLNLLTSVDAGTSATYKLIKNSNAFEKVWSNLEGYKQRGASVTLKYLVTEENCQPQEIEAFIAHASALGPASIVLDIDYRKPQPSEPVLTGLVNLYRLAQNANIHCTYGSVGGNSALEYGVKEFIESRTILPQAPENKPLFINYEKGDHSGTADEPSTLVLTTHRAASTLLSKILDALHEATQIPLHSQNGPSKNLGHFTPLESATVLQGRYGIIGPLRIPVHERILKRCNIVLHLRDPRDVLVSLYYAFAYSHADIEDADRAAAQTMGVDQFVLQRATVYAKRYEEYARMTKRHSVQMVRYEELISDPQIWLKKFLAPFALNNENASDVEARIAKILDNEVTIPPTENIYSHVRQVAQDDHKRKLKPETIAALDELFTPACNQLGISLNE